VKAKAKAMTSRHQRRTASRRRFPRADSKTHHEVRLRSRLHFGAGTAVQRDVARHRMSTVITLMTGKRRKRANAQIKSKGARCTSPHEIEPLNWCRAVKRQCSDVSTRPVSTPVRRKDFTPLLCCTSLLPKCTRARRPSCSSSVRRVPPETDSCPRRACPVTTSEPPRRRAAPTVMPRRRSQSQQTGLFPSRAWPVPNAFPACRVSLRKVRCPRPHCQ